MSAWAATAKNGGGAGRGAAGTGSTVTDLASWASPGSQEFQSAVELGHDALHALRARCGLESEGWEAIVCRRCPYDLGP